MNNKSIIGITIGAASVIIIITAIAMSAQSDTNKKNDLARDLITGKYDSSILSKCEQKLRSYGIYDSGAANICTDAAKLYAYKELTK